MTVDIVYLALARNARLRRKYAKEYMKRLLTEYPFLLIFTALQLRGKMVCFMTASHLLYNSNHQAPLQRFQSVV